MQLTKRIEMFNTSKRLPIVVAIDTIALNVDCSSLNESKYEIAKNLLNRLIQDILSNRKLYNAVEICFIKNVEIRRSEFCMVDECVLNAAELSHSPENLILYAYEKLFGRIKRLQEAEIGYYTPLIIFVGDEKFEMTNIDVNKGKNVYTAVVNIGKTTWRPTEDGNIETFSVASMAIAERFDIRKIIQYILDGRRSCSDMYLDEMKSFHNYCEGLREKLVDEKDTTSSVHGTNEEIINTIRADMEALLADLIEE